MLKVSLTIAAAGLLAGCGVSTQQEVQMGQQEAQQVSAQLPMVQDAIIQNYVNNLGQRIARTTSRSDLNWQFQVVNSSVVNAFALPGGFIYINRGVLERASNMSEVAGVLGHEIEHVVRRHSVKQRAGISPRGMYTFFQKLLAEEQQSGGSGNAAAWFADHPGTTDRIADIQRMLNQVPASTLNSLQTNDSGFATMKSRLNQLGPAPRVQGQ